MKAYVVIFVSVFMAELGDKTQLATLLFAANPVLSKVGVFAVATAALMLSTLIAVVVGDRIGEWISAACLARLAGIAFLAIGVWMLVRA